jgi:hypothetical protein
MGWIAITKNRETYREGDPNPEFGGRPVAKGEEGSLAVIAQEDFGHKVAVDLFLGVIIIGYDSIGEQNGQVEVSNPGTMLWICDETNIAGELMNMETEYIPYEDEKGRRYIDPGTKEVINVRNDTLIPLVWRPIWFTRLTNGIPTKVIGAQTTLPPEYTGKNVKKMVSLFADGRLGID